MFRLFDHGSEALTMGTPETITGGESSQSSGRDPADAGGEYAQDLPGPRVRKKRLRGSQGLAPDTLEAFLIRTDQL